MLITWSLWKSGNHSWLNNDHGQIKPCPWSARHIKPRGTLSCTKTANSTFWKRIIIKFHGDMGIYINSLYFPKISCRYIEHWSRKCCFLLALYDQKCRLREIMFVCINIFRKRFCDIHNWACNVARTWIEGGQDNRIRAWTGRGRWRPQQSQPAWRV